MGQFISQTGLSFLLIGSGYITIKFTLFVFLHRLSLVLINIYSRTSPSAHIPSKKKKKK